MQNLEKRSKETREQKEDREEQKIEKEIRENEENIAKQKNNQNSSIKTEFYEQILITKKEKLLDLKIRKQKYSEAKNILEQVLEFRENYDRQENPFTTTLFDKKRNKEKLKILKEVNNKLLSNEKAMDNVSPF